MDQGAIDVEKQKTPGIFHCARQSPYISARLSAKTINRMKAPKFKLQLPNKTQALMPKRATQTTAPVDLVLWFAWNLEFGIDASPLMSQRRRVHHQHRDHAAEKHQ